MTTVRIHIQDLEVGKGQNWQFFEAHWDLPRNHRYTYLTEAKGSNAAEQAFHIFNAPVDWLEEWQRYIAQNYTGPSLSVGDIVEVDGVEYLCSSIGWQTRDGGHLAVD
jgi:hypothetical protein